MIVPTRCSGDEFIADGTASSLSQPQLFEPRGVPEVQKRLTILSFLEIDFPFGVVRIGETPNLDMALDRYFRGFKARLCTKLVKVIEYSAKTIKTR